MYACSDGSLSNGEGGGGVYIASTQNLAIIHILPNSVRLNKETRWDRLVQNVNVRIFGGTDKVNSMGSVC